MNKIEYKGYIYEVALKVNRSFEETVDDFFSVFSILDRITITSQQYIMTVDIVDKNNKYPVEIWVQHTDRVGKISGSSEKVSGGYNLDIYIPENIKQELISLLSTETFKGNLSAKFMNFIREQYSLIKELLYHEFLHIIDPKVNNKELADRYFTLYIEKGNKYFTHILERDQFLSSKAKLVVETIPKDEVKNEITKNFDNYFKMLPRALQTPNFRKTFANCYITIMMRVRRPPEGRQIDRTYKTIHYLIGPCEVVDMHFTMKSDCYYSYKTEKYHLKKSARKFCPYFHIVDIRKHIKDFTLIEIVDYEVRVYKF